MRRALALLIVAACAAPASADAHVVNTDNTVLLVPGSQYGKVDCKAVYGAMEARLGEMKIKSQGRELKFKKLVTLSPQPGGANCDESLPGGPGNTEGLARTFSDWVAKTYPDHPVDVVAEGTSGVVVRYAIGMSGKEGWPKLDVEDAVTIGAPHGGSDKFAGKCGEVCGEMNKTDGSPLWTKLGQPAFQHPGTTDWSAIGSEGNDLTAPESAIAMDADHKTTFKGSLTQQALLADAKAERDAQIEYSHRGGPVKTWNKAPHAADRVGLELAFGADREAAAERCPDELLGWKFEFDCGGGDVEDGAENVSVTPPDSLKDQIPSIPKLPFAMPLRDEKHLLKPILLPSFSLSAGGLQLSAYENFLGDEGLTIGGGTLDVGRFGTASVYDLALNTDGSVDAGSMELEAFGGQIAADGIHFSRADGLSAKQATLYLPKSLGSTELVFSDLGIDADGNVRGTLSGGTLKIGEITAEFREAKVDPNGLTIGNATLKLPKYLGSAELKATNLRWDGKKLSLSEASGKLDFALAGGKARVAADVTMKIVGSSGYEISGSGLVSVPGSGGTPFFEAAASVKVNSTDCRPTTEFVAGACPKPVYLREASLSIKTGRPLPLGNTGLALTGLHGGVKASHPRAWMDSKRELHDVIYTFNLGASLASYPSDFAFTGDVDGSLSTNGNLGVSLTNAKVFRFIDLNGGACVVLDNVAADTVCEKPLGEHVRKVAGPGAYVRGKATAGVKYDGTLVSFNANISADVFGRYVQTGGKSYVDAEVTGKLSANADVGGLGAVQGQGTVNAQLGKFRSPGGEVIGLKGTLSAELRASSSLFNRSYTLQRSMFVDTNGKYTEENVNSYNLVEPPAVAPKRAPSAAARAAVADGVPLPIARGQTETMIVVAAKDGSPELELTTPRGTRVSIPSPGTVRVVDGEARDAANVYAVRGGAPHSLSVYLPEAQPGRWTARVTGVEPGSFRLDVSGNKPLPRLAVKSPGARGAKVTPRRRSVAVRGTLRGAAAGTTVSLYAVRGSCRMRQGRPLKPGGGLELGTGVSVRQGSWRRRWNTRGVPAGPYTVYALADNGSGPLVTACSKGTVTVAAKKRHKPSRKRPARRRAHARPVTRSILRRPIVRPAAPKIDCADLDKMVETDEMVDVPVWRISKAKADDMKEVAKNMAAGITGQEPGTPPWLKKGKARTVDYKTGGYKPYKWPGERPPYQLSYSRMKPERKCQSSRPQNYKETCKMGPFRTSPGPPDPAGTMTSCDEFPFASTLQGGNHDGVAAIVRGVPKRDNDVQGGQFGGVFLTERYNDLVATHGEFDVCVVQYDAGACDKARQRQVKKWVAPAAKP